MSKWLDSSLVSLQKVLSEFLGKCQWFWTLVLQETRLFQIVLFPSFAAHDNQNCSTSHDRLAVLPQYGYIFQRQGQNQNSPLPLPAIYSGIGLGVYQGEIVVFRQMAIGDRRWVVSKLRFEDFPQLPDSVLSDVFLTSCLLRLSHIQSDLVRKGLQEKSAMQLMKSLCPLADNLYKLQTNEGGDDNLSLESRTSKEKRCHLKCLVR